MTTYANRPALQFEDAEGLRLVLLVSNGEKVRALGNLGEIRSSCKASNSRNGFCRNDSA